LSGGITSFREGTGRPVVLLPGLQGDPLVFEPLFHMLALGRPLLGLRLSEGGLPADCALLEATEIRSLVEGADLICGSYGGQVALRADVPFESIVMTGSFPRFIALPSAAKAKLRASLAMPSLLLGGVNRRRSLSRLQADGVPNSLATRLNRPSGKALRARLMSLRGLEGVQVSCPLLWIAGKKDAQSPWTEPELEDTWPGIRVCRVPGKHRPYASDPQTFVRTVEDWWSSVDAGK
jgi:pimeloyl-ACP methyl ester carboxylesterase